MSTPDPPADTVVPELTVQRARAAPDAVAVDWSTGPVTARELDRWADRIAAALTGAAGRAVVVRVPSGPGRYAALVGVLRAGAHLIWFGSATGGERGRAVVDSVDPAAVLVGDLPDEVAAAYAARAGVPLVDVTTLPERAVDHLPPVAPRSWAYVAHTSGSTGVPKGVPQTHGALAQFSTWFATEFRFGPGVRVAQWVAPEHDPAVCETFAALVSGAVLCPVPEPVRAHPGRMLDWMAAERIDVLQTVPSFAKELLRESAGRNSASPLALRLLLLMGEAVPEALVRGLHAAAPRIALANLYGPTETVAATWFPIPRGWRGPIPIGRAIPGREVLVLDDADAPCPPGAVGELVVRSPYVTPGYLDRPEGHPAFRPVAGRGSGPWYRTGDLGLRRTDGLLEYRGRRDQQVKVQGHRLELAEVESVLLRDDTVVECAVLPVHGPDGAVTGLVGHVVPRGDAEPAHWRAQVRLHFGGLLLPLRFRIEHGGLPRTPAGKVDRRRLARSRPAPAPSGAGTSRETAS